MHAWLLHLRPLQKLVRLHPDAEVGYFHLKDKGVDWVFVEHPSFPRPGGIYADAFGVYGDNQVRLGRVRAFRVCAHAQGASTRTRSGCTATTRCGWGGLGLSGFVPTPRAHLCGRVRGVRRQSGAGWGGGGPGRRVAWAGKGRGRGGKASS